MFCFYIKHVFSNPDYCYYIDFLILFLFIYLLTLFINVRNSTIVYIMVTPPLWWRHTRTLQRPLEHQAAPRGEVDVHLTWAEDVATFSLRKDFFLPLESRLPRDRGVHEHDLQENKTVIGLKWTPDPILNCRCCQEMVGFTNTIWREIRNIVQLLA